MLHRDWGWMRYESQPKENHGQYAKIRSLSLKVNRREDGEENYTMAML